MKLKYIIRSTAVALFGFIAILGTQIVTTANAVYQARESAIQTWEKSNPLETQVVKRFRSECLRGSPEITANRTKIRPLTIAQCADEIVGGRSLAAAIDAAYLAVDVPAPLRWL